MASEICTLEIEHAVKHNKRLVPVVWKNAEDSQVHSAMTAHNWVFLRTEDDFAELSGVGERKQEKYGPAFMNIIENYLGERTGETNTTKD